MAAYEESPRRRPGMAWRERALCRDRDPLPWMDVRLADVAREVCEDCPVRLSCLGAALEWECQQGHADPLMFGGKTPDERNAMLTRFPVRR